MTTTPDAVNEHESNVRMPTARCLTEPNVGKISAWDAIALRDRWREEGGIKPTFRCLCCDAWVHPRRNSRTETKQGGEPFFARNASPQTGPRNAHAPSCGFALSHRVREIQKESGGALTSRFEDGQVVYRLSLPKTFAPSDSDHGGAGPSPSDQEFTLEISKVLNTAIKITQMLAEFERAGATVEADFRATCDGKDVAWLDFMYTPGRIITLARRIENNGPLTHPVAVVVNPAKNPERHFNTGRWRTFAWIKRPAADEGRRNLFMYAPDPDWLPKKGPRGHVGYGMWYLRPARPYEDHDPLCLDLPDQDCSAPLPVGMTPSVLDAWAGGAVLRSARVTPEDQLEESP
ncbi:hypothetical protein AB3X52_08350 [Nocardioides sp. DS6]|uniref:Uncharacterized protein n=1 Tax=Nocardioides eburneus TaxID=3231482 RepID=A0ABV3SXG3_9ACTN